MRILAGQFRGRKLLSPSRHAQARPITGLAKKSLFDTLGPRLVDAVVADLYCGTGTMGLEALSRGAARVALAERDADTVARLKRNVADLDAEGRCTVWRGDVTRRLSAWLGKLSEPVDLAFVDPPYAAVRKWDWGRAQRSLFAPLAEHLAPDGLVVLRTPAGADTPETLAGLACTREKTYGDMHVRFYARPE